MGGHLKLADKDQSQLLAYADDLAKVYGSEKQKRAELETQNKKLRATINGILDGVVAIDSDKIVTEANHVFSKLIGIPVDQLIGQQFFEVLPTGAWRDFFDGLEWDARSDEIVIDLERDRQHFFRVARTPLINGGDTLQGWVITLHDETERKRTEGLKDEFLSLVSHEIRTPMNAIMGFSSILESKLEDSLSKEEQKYFGLIRSGTERLLNTVEELIEASESALDEPHERAGFDLKDAARKAVDSITHRYRDGEIKIVQIYPETDCMVTGYPEIISRAISHLLDNAVSFSPENSEVTVELVDAGTWWEVNVINQGEGIPTDQLEKVFDKFYQVEAQHTRTHEGLGLGLYNVKKAAVLHGGEINLQSTPGEGTRASLRLPKQQPLSLDADSHEYAELQQDLALLQAQNIAYAKDLAETYRSRKQATTQLELTRDQLVRSDKLASMGTMAAGIAHEVNNMLTPIMGNAYLLRQISAEVTPDMERMIANIEDASKRAAEMLRQVLDFSRKGPETLEPTDIAGLVNRVLSLLEYRLRKGKVQVHKEFGTAPIIATGNGKQLEQVFTNLIINAIDAMEDGGELAISIEQQNSSETNIVEIRLSDNGPGIPENIRESIFEPFFSTKEEGKGTGLGLFISYGIIEKHGGILEVESEVGKGSAFTITLPAPDEDTITAK